MRVVCASVRIGFRHSGHEPDARGGRRRWFGALTVVRWVMSPQDQALTEAARARMPAACGRARTPAGHGRPRHVLN